MKSWDEFREKQVDLCKSAAWDEINKGPARRVKLISLDLGGHWYP